MEKEEKKAELERLIEKCERIEARIEMLKYGIEKSEEELKNVKDRIEILKKD